MVKFDFKPDLSKNDDWYFEILSEDLKKRNKLKKFFKIVLLQELKKNT